MRIPSRPVKLYNLWRNLQWSWSQDQWEERKNIPRNIPNTHKLKDKWIFMQRRKIMRSWTSAQFKGFVHQRLYIKRVKTTHRTGKCAYFSLYNNNNMCNILMCNYVSLCVILLLCVIVIIKDYIPNGIYLRNVRLVSH